MAETGRQSAGIDVQFDAQFHFDETIAGPFEEEC